MKSYHSPFNIELLSSKKDWIIFLGFTLFIFCLSLAFEYYHYRLLLNAKSIDAKVLLQYKKDSKDYYVLKLKSAKQENFYTTSKDDLKDLRGRYVNVYGKLSNDCTFLSYLNSCFFVGYSISLLHKTDSTQGILDYIASQHSNDFGVDEFNKSLFAQMYQSLFFATPMPSELRSMTNAFGVAHIIAISGFHLSILSLMIYLLLKYPYRFFQRRYFPYRNEFYDINILVISFALAYLYILDFTPSFLRSVVMFALGFYILYRGLKLLSFKLLFACVVFILALFPRIYFNIGFWLSVAGVFYIYLFLKHFKCKNKVLYSFWLDIVVFFNMLPLAHYTFFNFSLYVIFAPLITIAFVVFYPLVLLLHIIGYGGIFDSLLYAITQLDFGMISVKCPFWFLCIFISVSFIAIFNKFAYYFTIFLSIVFFLYGIKGLL